MVMPNVWLPSPNKVAVANDPINGAQNLNNLVTIPITQTLTFAPDGTYDIGGAIGNRPRNINMTGNLIVNSQSTLQNLTTNGLAIFNSGVIATQGTVLGLSGQGGQAQLYGGTGAPTNNTVPNGSYYLRGDTPTIANQRLYVFNAGAWTGIL